MKRRTVPIQKQVAVSKKTHKESKFIDDEMFEVFSVKELQISGATMPQDKQKTSKVSLTPK